MKNVRIILVLVILLFPATVWATMDGSLASISRDDARLSTEMGSTSPCPLPAGEFEAIKKGQYDPSWLQGLCLYEEIDSSSTIKRFGNTSASCHRKPFLPFIGKEGLIRKLSWARRWRGSKMDTGERNGRADGSSISKAGQEPLPSIRHCFRRGWIQKH